jgi:hypothetical protein
MPVHLCALPLISTRQRTASLRGRLAPRARAFGRYINGRSSSSSNTETASHVSNQRPLLSQARVIALVFSGVFQPRHGLLKGERMILKAQRGPSAHKIDYCCGHRRPRVVAGI